MTIYIYIFIYTHINVSVCIALLLSYFDISRCFFHSTSLVVFLSLRWPYGEHLSTGASTLFSSPEALYGPTPYRSESNRAHCIAYLVLVKRMDMYFSIMNMYQFFCLLDFYHSTFTCVLHLKHAVSHCFEHHFAAKSMPPFGSSRSSRWQDLRSPPADSESPVASNFFCNKRRWGLRIYSLGVAQKTLTTKWVKKLKY